MLLTGAYSIFCWLLAEPIVMPIWNNFIKPCYYGFLNGIYNFGLGCVRMWREFWNSPPASETPAKADADETHQKAPQTKSFAQTIYPLLFTKRQELPKISRFSSKAAGFSPSQTTTRLRVEWV
jgi:hypothetical protein